MVYVDNFKKNLRESRKPNRQSGFSWGKVTLGLVKAHPKSDRNTERELS